MRRQRIRFPFRRGAIAAPAWAWGEEFEVVYSEDRAARPYSLSEGIAVVDICGPLEQHAGWMCDSYDDIRCRVTAAIASEAKTVVIRINSPGGDFAGAIELAKELRTLAQSSAKRLVAYTDSAALSAGYALACAADEIVITESGFVGSIGVWSALVDATAQNRAMGLNIAVIASGARKVDRNPNVALSDDAITAAQAQVDAMAALFFEWVSESRGLSLEAIRKLEGAEFFGKSAVGLQLADRIVNSWGDLVSSLNSSKEVVMPKPFDEALSKAKEELMKVAEGDDEDAKAARRMLDKMSAEDDGEEKKDEDKKESKAEGEDKEKMKAEDEEKEDKAAARSGSLRLAHSSSDRDLALAKRLHVLEAQIAADKEYAARQSLLAKRPDFSPEVRATLESADLAFVKSAVETWPRGSTPAAASASATVPGGTRGPVNSAPQVSPEDAAFIAKHMSRQAGAMGIISKGNTLTLGTMSREEAQAHLEKLAKEGK